MFVQQTCQWDRREHEEVPGVEEKQEGAAAAAAASTLAFMF